MPLEPGGAALSSAVPPSPSPPSFSTTTKLTMHSSILLNFVSRNVIKRVSLMPRWAARRQGWLPPALVRSAHACC